MVPEELPVSDLSWKWEPAELCGGRQLRTETKADLSNVATRVRGPESPNSIGHLDS